MPSMSTNAIVLVLDFGLFFIPLLAAFLAL